MGITVIPVALLSVYLGIHTLVFLRIRVLFMDRGLVQWTLALFFLLMSLAPIAGYVLDRYGHDSPARLVAHIGFSWIGFVFFAFIASVLMSLFDLGAWGVNALAHLVPQARFSIPLLSGKMPALVMVIAVGLACGYGVLEARRIHVERLQIETDKLPPNTDTLTIAQISDLHLGLMARGRFLKAVAGKLASLSPDILVSTGDLVDGSSSNLNDLAGIFAQLQVPHGKYAVTGNHEYYAGLDKSLAFHRRSGFAVLRGESVTLGGLVNIAGVDDANVRAANGTTGTSRAKQVHEALAGVDSRLFTLLLMHRPEVAQASLGRFDLQLSGHTHKGQLFPFNHLVKRQYPLMAGLHDLGEGSRIYINRGTGTWGPPMRVLSPPEITMIELVRPMGSP